MGNERRERERLALIRRRALRQQRLHAEKKADNTGRCYYGRNAWGGCEVGGKRSGNGGGKPRAVKKTPITFSKESQCYDMCKAKKQSCSTDYKIGSNQFVSCAQACVMRIQGVS